MATTAAFSLDLVDRIGGAVDAVGAEERATRLATRSIKKDSKLWALDLAVRCCDLTTLEGQDSPGKIRQLASKAMRPSPTDPKIPHVAALCVYPRLVAPAAAALENSGVVVASVATGFPSGQTPLDLRLLEIERAVADGADEIDTVISRGAFLAGDDQTVFDEIVASKRACGDAHLKVILETGELGSYDRIRKASLIAMAAGADFIKTSTGKEDVNATLPVSLVMVRALREYRELTGVDVGFKPAGGLKTAKDALNWFILMKEELGRDWLEPDLFRIGASSLLGDIERQIEHFVTGRYSSSMRHALA